MSTPELGGESSRDPREAFAELSKIMLGEQQLSETLARVAELAKQSIPGAAEVSVTLLHGTEVASVVFTGPLASQLDERQYEAGFGPCIDAALSGTAIAIEDTADSSIYPDFTTRELATAFASYAAVALANADLYASTASLAANLQRALESRAVIDQAKGILMRDHRISADGAFDLLTQLSNTSNRKLREIAQDIVDEAQREPLQ